MKKQLTPEEKELKKQKRKERKEENDKKETVTVDSSEQTFLNKEGNHVKLLDFLRPDEIWEKEDKRTENDRVTITKKKILLKDAVNRLAKEAGVYYFDKVVLHTPTIENNDLHAYDVTIYCNALKKDDFCIHGYYKTTMVGASSNLNTRNINMKHKDANAEKRGFVRAVVTHLGLKGIYGDEEFDEERVDTTKIDKPSPAEFEALGGQEGILNRILNAEDQDKLDALAEEILAKKKEYTEKQLEYLRGVWDTKSKSFRESKF